VEPEPISPAGRPCISPSGSACPSPIGLEADILAGLDRLLPSLCDKLRAQGRGARRVRLELSRADGEHGNAGGRPRPSRRPARRHPYRSSRSRLGDIDAGFGFDRLRLCAP
jgi:protein ImuB